MLPLPAVRAFLLTLFLCSFLACSRAQEYSVGAGEIRFDGIVVSHDQTGQSLVLNVSSFTLPNGKSSQLAKSKEKTILFPASTVVLISGKTPPKSAPALPIGQPIIVIGKDVGSAKDFSARIIAWDDLEQSTPAAEAGNSKALKIKAGETLFEGKLTGILSATNLTINVSTTTSAKGEKTDIFPLESKTITMDANTILRSQNDANRNLQSAI